MSRYPQASSGRRRPPEDPPLPRGFTSIREMLDGRLRDKTFTNVVGLVKDYRLPVLTRGTDWKCTFTLFDQSTEEDDYGIDLNIFRKEQHEMPTAGAGDVIIASQVKYQTWGGGPNLITNLRTEIHVYEAQRLPSCRTSGSASAALRSPPRKPSRNPDAKENEYVLWLWSKIDKSAVPDQERFAARTEQSLNVKNKFTLLQDVKDKKFADLVAQVVREPFDLVDRICLWVSDYTENATFFNRTADGAQLADGMPYRDGDPYGYTDKFSRKSAQRTQAGGAWLGPYGKRSIQLTCWEPHANFIRENVHANDWVRLRNVQIGYGHNSLNIEGFVRQDRDFPNRVCVDVLDILADRETVDPRLRDALRRKRDYEKKEKGMQEKGEKRKAERPPQEDNAKRRRTKMREAQRKAEEEQKAKQEAALNLNDLIICENQGKALVPLHTIIEPVYYQTTVNMTPTTVELPFTCAKYRTLARVVDFHPTTLKDFAVRRRVTEYDILSDNEDSSGDSDSSESSAGSHTRCRHVWEWRFALKLQEPTSPLEPPKASKKPATAWVLVDNMDAQLLTGLDAGDLHAADGEPRLVNLRERMFQLWGNLEERKSSIETQRRKHARNPLRAPPADSSGAEDNAGGGDDEAGGAAHARAPSSSQLSNKPFECCIRQYGVQVAAEKSDEEDDEEASEGKRWARMFALFGTMIVRD